MKNKVKDRIKRAEAIALESLDYILETVPVTDYVQITGITGRAQGVRNEPRKGAVRRNNPFRLLKRVHCKSRKIVVL